ncbi:hypothetical protein RAB80_001608 [Fusarium oxysporum f. sp. vasinfectum]|nr:hypothetical protein RAB80_001608 [Fusarium oxysporum f. sp. vasinfectum]
MSTLPRDVCYGISNEHGSVCREYSALFAGLAAFLTSHISTQKFVYVGP